jgi:hypothetical protein
MYCNRPLSGVVEAMCGSSFPRVGRTHADDQGFLLRRRLARYEKGSESKPRH